MPGVSCLFSFLPVLLPKHHLHHLYGHCHIEVLLLSSQCCLTSLYCAVPANVYFSVHVIGITSLCTSYYFFLDMMFMYTFLLVSCSKTHLCLPKLIFHYYVAFHQSSSCNPKHHFSVSSALYPLYTARPVPKLR